MTLGERGLDGALAFAQPIERGVEFVLVDLAQAEFDARLEAAVAGSKVPLGGRPALSRDR
jgi:hypothetical protein